MILLRTRAALLVPLLAVAGCAGNPLPVTPHLQALTPFDVFAKAPPAKWREPDAADPALAPVEVACGASPRLADGPLYVAVRVTGRPAQTAIAPLNVSLVLDRSGSMRGRPFLDMLRAAETFVGQLREGDRLSVVVFSDGVFQPVAPVVIHPASRAGAVAAVRALRHGGLTNLSGGLLAGLFDVWDLQAEWSVSQLLLLSDGQPNRGITDRSQLAALAADAAERGVGVTTVGFGPEHDELLMQALADAGGGTYHYVESPADIPVVFEREAAELLSVAARDVVVQVEVPPGLVVEDVIGRDYYLDAGRLWVRLGAVPHGQERYIVLRLRAGQGAPAALPVSVVGSDMARRARFGAPCRPVLPGSGEDRWVLELAGRAEGSWGLAEAMALADSGNEPFAIAQASHTRGLLTAMRAHLGPDAFADEDGALLEVQVRFGNAVAAEATNASRRGVSGLVDFGLSTAVAATAPAFHPLSRAALQGTWYGRPVKFFSARSQHKVSSRSGDRNRTHKAARFDAYQRMRSGQAPAARPAGARPVEPTGQRSRETRPAEVRPRDARPPEGSPVDRRFSGAERDETRPPEARPVDVRSRDAEPADTRRGDRRSRDAEPADTGRGDRRSRDAEPADTRPGDRRSRDAEPADTRRDDRRSRDAEPADGRRGDRRSRGAEPADDGPSRDARPRR